MSKPNTLYTWDQANAIVDANRKAETEGWKYVVRTASDTLNMSATIWYVVVIDEEWQEVGTL